MHSSIPRLAEALTDLLKQPLAADPPTRAAVLGWVNHARRAIDLLPLNQLPKGIPGDVWRCRILASPLAGRRLGRRVEPGRSVQTSTAAGSICPSVRCRILP